MDDVHWVKPEGAGWANGRGRRFAADRNPLQYKPVPVTEYVLVYRKHTDSLIGDYRHELLEAEHEEVDQILEAQLAGAPIEGLLRKAATAEQEDAEEG